MNCKDGGRGKGRSEWLTTGEMARMSRTTLRTVRFYEAEGLIVSRAREDGSHRKFPPSELKKLQIISDLREAGLSLQEIKTLIALKGRCSDRRARPPGRCPRRFASQVRELERRIETLQRVRDELAAMVEMLRRVPAAATHPDFPTRCRDCELIDSAARRPRHAAAVEKLNARGRAAPPRSAGRVESIARAAAAIDEFLRALGFAPEREPGSARHRARSSPTRTPTSCSRATRSTRPRSWRERERGRAPRLVALSDVHRRHDHVPASPAARERRRARGLCAGRARRRVRRAGAAGRVLRAPAHLAGDARADRSPTRWSRTLGARGAGCVAELAPTLLDARAIAAAGAARAVTLRHRGRDAAGPRASRRGVRSAPVAGAAQEARHERRPTERELRSLPVFPLPNLVLFPGTHARAAHVRAALPRHDRRLPGAAADGDGRGAAQARLAGRLPRPPAAVRRRGRGPRSSATLRQRDGTYDIQLEGVARVRLRRAAGRSRAIAAQRRRARGDACRPAACRARARHAADAGLADRGDRAAREPGRAHAAARLRSTTRRRGCSTSSPTSSSSDPEARQQLLETLDVGERLDLLKQVDRRPARGAAARPTRTAARARCIDAHGEPTSRSGGPCAGSSCAGSRGCGRWR